MIVLIDNYDSFTWNLYHFLGDLGCKTEVYRNDKISVTDVIKLKPSQIPKKWGNDFFLPNLIPEAISIELLGPGVIEVTNAKIPNSIIREV